MNVRVSLGVVDGDIVTVRLVDILRDAVLVCVVVMVTEVSVVTDGDGLIRGVDVGDRVVVRLRLVVDVGVGVRVTGCDEEAVRVGCELRVGMIDRNDVRVLVAVRDMRVVAVPVAGGAPVCEGRDEGEPEDDVRVERVPEDEAVVVRDDVLVRVLDADCVDVRVGIAVCDGCVLRVTLGVNRGE